MRYLIALSTLLILFASCSPLSSLPARTITVTLPSHTGEINSHTLTLNSTAMDAPDLTPSATPDFPEQIMRSPNGKYVAKRYGPYKTPSLHEPIIRIFNGKDELLWEIPFQGEQPQGEPGISLVIDQWANDSSRLYFKYTSHPDGGDSAFRWDGFDLQSIDIKTGDIRRVLPGEGRMAFAFSPDGSQIAYTRSQDSLGILYLRDLAGETDTKIIVQPEQEYRIVGDIHWSPSGKGLIFHTDGKSGELRGLVQVIYLNLDTLEQKVVKQYNVESMRFEEWVGERQLRFRGLRDEPIFLIDLFTGEVSLLGTATPLP